MQIFISIYASLCALQMILAAPGNILANQACPPGTVPVQPPRCFPGSQDPRCLLTAGDFSYVEFACVVPGTAIPATTPPLSKMAIPAVPPITPDTLAPAIADLPKLAPFEN
jgi:hypothetical protein